MTALATAAWAGPNICTACLAPFDRDLGDHHGRRLGQQVRREHGQQVRVAFALAGQGVGERVADGAVFAADQEVDVGDLVAFACECFTDKHAHMGLLGRSGFSLTCMGGRWLSGSGPDLRVIATK